MYKPFFKPKIKEQRTSRLVLRAFGNDDLSAYYKVLSNKSLAAWLGQPEGFSEPEVKNWIDGMRFWWDKHGYGPWAVLLQDTGQLIGHCGLKFAEELGHTELMYAIHPDFQGRGLATEASAFALEYGFVHHNLSKIIAYTLPTNQASIAVLKKIGMSPLGQVMHGNVEHVLFGIQP